MENVAKHNCSHAITKVIFRKYKKDGDILALFPEVPGTTDPGTCQCYEHIGQHGTGDYLHCLSITVPAKPDEYADLKRELEQLGYCLRVMKKATYRDFQNKQNQWR